MACARAQVSCQQLGPREKGGLVLGLDIQEATLPPKHCDDRVKVMTADARLLTPDMLLAHTKDVSGKGGGDRGQGTRDGSCCLQAASPWKGRLQGRGLHPERSREKDLNAHLQQCGEAAGASNQRVTCFAHIHSQRPGGTIQVVLHQCSQALYRGCC